MSTAPSIQRTSKPCIAHLHFCSPLAWSTPIRCHLSVVRMISLSSFWFFLIVLEGAAGSTPSARRHELRYLSQTQLLCQVGFRVRIIVHRATAGALENGRKTAVQPFMCPPLQEFIYVLFCKQPLGNRDLVPRTNLRRTCTGNCSEYDGGRMAVLRRASGPIL